MSSLSLFLVVVLTGIILVIAGLGIAILLAPKSFNLQKGEPYECGIPTHGTSWMQFKAGYYLYAILYLMFDVETIFLFPCKSSLRCLLKWHPENVTVTNNISKIFTNLLICLFICIY